MGWKNDAERKKGTILPQPMKKAVINVVNKKKTQLEVYLNFIIYHMVHYIFICSKSKRCWNGKHVV